MVALLILLCKEKRLTATIIALLTLQSKEGILTATIIARFVSFLCFAKLILIMVAVFFPYRKKKERNNYCFLFFVRKKDSNHAKNNKKKSRKKNSFPKKNPEKTENEITPANFLFFGIFWTESFWQFDGQAVWEAVPEIVTYFANWTA